MQKSKDYCTMWFENWFGEYIGNCCKKHDEDYENQTESKEESDEDLFKCIFKTVPFYKLNFVLAVIMWIGVRVGGLKSWNREKNENR